MRPAIAVALCLLFAASALADESKSTQPAKTENVFLDGKVSTEGEARTIAKWLDMALKARSIDNQRLGTRQLAYIASRAQSEADTEEVVLAIKTLFKTKGDNIARDAVVFAVHESRNEKLFPELRGCLIGSNDDITIRACRLVADIGDEQSEKPLLAIAQTHRNLNCRHEAAVALATCGTQASIKPLESQLKKEREMYVREGIAKTLDKLDERFPKN